MEEWKKINDLEGFYSISNLGRVKSNKRTIKTKSGKTVTYSEKIRTLQLNSCGYPKVNLFCRCRCVPFLVHRLVATHFLDNPFNKPQVNHKNGIKTDARASNLEWVTASENCLHAINSNLYQTARGEKSGASKLTEREVREIRSLCKKGGVLMKDIALKFGISRQYVSAIKNKQRWKHL